MFSPSQKPGLKTISGTPSSPSGSAKSSRTSGSAAADPAEGSLASALARLNAALDGLDNAVETSNEERKKVQNADQQVQRMSDDRAKLAKQLDSAEARANRLKEVNSEVSRRLVNAMEMVRGVLDQKT